MNSPLQNPANLCVFDWPAGTGLFIYNMEISTIENGGRAEEAPTGIFSKKYDQKPFFSTNRN